MITHSDITVLEGEPDRNGLPDNHDALSINDEDVFFAKERYNLHQSSPEEGVDADILKKYFSRKYGF